jgi:hypothetical protein
MHSTTLLRITALLVLALALMGCHGTIGVSSDPEDPAHPPAPSPEGPFEPRGI